MEEKIGLFEEKIRVFERKIIIFKGYNLNNIQGCLKSKRRTKKLK